MRAIGISGFFMLATLTTSFAAAAEPSASPDGAWRHAERAVEEKGELSIREGSYALFELDEGWLSEALSRLPRESADGEADRLEPAWLPMPDGTFMQVAAVESPVMEPELAERFPQIRTFRAQGTGEEVLTARFDDGPAGFHAILLFEHKTVYVAPYRRFDKTLYVSYDRAGLLDTASYLEPGELSEELIKEAAGFAPPASTENTLVPRFAPTAAGNAGTRRVYRLAVASAAEFTLSQSPVVGGIQTIDIPATIAAIVSATNSVNAIYDRDVAVRFLLVGNMQTLIFGDPLSDPYSVGNKFVMMFENQATVDLRVKDPNYDIGHVFSGGPDGGIAFPFTCLSGLKAYGVSQGGTNSLMVEEMAHELGHQLGATHTFNGTQGHCGDPLQRWASSAYEPGSGSTIMSYGGDCGPDNIVLVADSYFHAGSLEQIIGFTVSGIGGSCAMVVPTQNHAPTIAPVPNFVIPRNTPFTLSTFAIDPDEGDKVTFTWEQMDLTALHGEPILRSRPPSGSGSRTFPRIEDVLSNTPVFGELLPTTDRKMSFRVTARDNHSPGGNVTWQDFELNVEGPPFRVTSQNKWGISWPIGSTQLVTWTPVGAAASVNILLSLDGGKTWMSLLPNTLNDGSEPITVPPFQTAQARIKVEAVGNVFFDVSDADVVIFAPPPTPVLEGEHTSSSCQAVEGWVWDKANPANTEYVDIYEEASTGPVLRASTWPGWLNSPGKGSGKSGFWWPLLRSMKDGSAYSFRVKFAGTGTDVQNTPLKTGACSLQGAIDPPTCTSVTGFALDPDWPGDAITVEVLQQNSGGTTTLVSGWLANLSGPQGPHDFNIPVAVSKGTSTIRVRFSDTHGELANSGATVTCP
jgi:hypothetical protein